MKKIAFVLLSMVAFAACNKEVKNEQPVAGGAPASFNVFSPETKTTIDGLSVKWTAGDQIRVYGHNTSTDAYDNGTYTLSSGAGTTAGVFTKDSGEELTGTYDAYYAVYPSTRSLSFSGSPLKMQLDKVAKNQTAVDNEKGFDPSFAVMTAVYDGSKLVFTHGAGYIKFVLTEDNISSVAINLGSNCLVQQPTYVASTGAYSSGGSGYSTVTLTPAGSANFTKGLTYYAPVFPRPDDTSKKISNISVTCAGGSSFQTTHFDDKVVEYGKVFDLGTLSKVTLALVNDITGVDVAGISTTHPVSFVKAVGWTPSIHGYTGCVSSASLVSTEEITSDLSENTINYTIGAYNALVGNTGTIVVRLSKAGEEPIDKTINVTQNTSSAPTPHTYVLYVNNSGTVVQTEDGNSGTFFTNTGTSTLLCASSGSKPYFGVDSYLIGSTSYNYAKKIDNSNGISFTTRSGVSSSIRFYAASRNTNTTATMYLKQGSTNVVTASLAWTDNRANLYDSGDVALTAETTYSFGKSGEVGLFYVVVTESAL